ncbi:MAG: hypothetical protein PW792_04480 [Acidobacteriaceae bacterium]|nr:hypothetical protein [Acidobacteriaceae bacterium]
MQMDGYYTHAMPTPCIFCDNNSGSREHFWPKWIHRRHQFGPLKMERRGRDRVVIPDPELTVKTVCTGCNNGWMSSLETESIPVLGAMVDDRPVDLSVAQQTLIAAWSVKTAMMSDSMKGRSAVNVFYTRGDCSGMRVGRSIPERTLVWIGRIDGMHLANAGTDFMLNDQMGKPLASCIATTIVAGHFVTQVVTVHLEQPEGRLDAIPCKVGDWDLNLEQIWPIQKPVAAWPPPVSFTNGGPEAIAYLLDRWRIGAETDIIANPHSTGG